MDGCGRPGRSAQAASARTTRSAASTVVKVCAECGEIRPNERMLVLGSHTGSHTAAQLHRRVVLHRISECCDATGSEHAVYFVDAGSDVDVVRACSRRTRHRTKRRRTPTGRLRIPPRREQSGRAAQRRADEAKHPGRNVQSRHASALGGEPRSPPRRVQNPSRALACPGYRQVDPPIHFTSGQPMPFQVASTSTALMLIDLLPAHSS